MAPVVRLKAWIYAATGAERSWVTYSISPGAIAFARVPAIAAGKVGRYDVPVFRLGRLAVDLSVQGLGLGGDLLLAADERALAEAAGCTLLPEIAKMNPKPPTNQPHCWKN